MSVRWIAVRCNNTSHPKKGMSMLKILFSSVWVRAIFEWPWKMVSVSVRYCFISQWMKRSKHRLFVFPPKKTLIMEKALFDWPIVLQYDVKAKYRLISRKFFGHEVFSAKRLTKTHARLYPFDKRIKSLYFRSFVVSVLFARFHFKVIRKYENCCIK